MTISRFALMSRGLGQLADHAARAEQELRLDRGAHHRALALARPKHVDRIVGRPQLLDLPHRLDQPLQPPPGRWREVRPSARAASLPSLDQQAEHSVLPELGVRATLARLTTQLTPTPFIVLILVYVVTVALYRVARVSFTRPEQLIERNPYELFLTLDYRYLFSKSFELLFQQIMIVVLILTIHRMTATMIHVIVIYGVIFSLAHLPIYPFIGTNEKAFRVFYIVASIASAVLFPLLILKIDCGFVYSYAIHLSFYTLAALILWRRHTRQTRSPDTR